MSKNPAQLVPAPRGMDATTDSVHLPLDLAQSLNNQVFDRPGILRSQVRWVDMIPQTSLPTHPIDGCGYYYGAFTAADRLLEVDNGFLYEMDHSGANQSFFPSFGFPAPPFVPPYPPTFTDRHTVGAFGRAGDRARMVQFGSEILIVQERGIIPYRYTGNNTLAFAIGTLFPCGFDMTGRAAPTLADGGAGGKGAGTFKYLYTLVDDKGRESSPSASASIILAASHQTNLTIPFINLPSNAGECPFVNLYSTLAGGNVYYRIAHVAKPAFGTDLIYTDSAPDSTVAAGVLAPLPGENDPPNQASLVAVWNNYVFFDDTKNIGYLQISNLNSAVQFNQLLDPARPDLGGRIQISTDQNDAIMAIIPLFSRLMILKRRSGSMLFGDTTADFVIRPLQIRGCIAKDSAQRCDNVIVFLSEDGVYGLDGNGGTEKISKPIEALLAPFFLSPQGRTMLENATGSYSNRNYRLTVGTTTFVYNFDAHGWGTESNGIAPFGTGLSQALIPLPGVIGGGGVANPAQSVVGPIQTLPAVATPGTVANIGIGAPAFNIFPGGSGGIAPTLPDRGSGEGGPGSGGGQGQIPTPSQV